MWFHHSTTLMACSQQSTETIFVGITHCMWMSQIGYSADQYCCFDYQAFFVLHEGVILSSYKKYGPWKNMDHFEKRRMNENMSRSEERSLHRWSYSYRIKQAKNWVKSGNLTVITGMLVETLLMNQILKNRQAHLSGTMTKIISFLSQPFLKHK